MMTSLVKHLSLEEATAIVAFIIGLYTFIGGLGATFYVSYFNSGIIFICMLIVLATVHSNDSTDILGAGSEFRFSVATKSCTTRYT